MATKKSTMQSFNVTGEVKLQISVEVEAESLDAALAIAHDFGYTDYLTINSGAEVVDSVGPEVIGVYKS